MHKRSFIDEVLSNVNMLDGVNGLFDIKNESHKNILYKHLSETFGSDIADEVNSTLNLTEAGRFPERQAYNRDGILVTFPTIDHKKEAMSTGDYFSVNPKDPSKIIGRPDIPKQKPKPVPVPEKSSNEIPDVLKDKVGPDKIIPTSSPAPTPVKKQIAVQRPASPKIEPQPLQPQVKREPSTPIKQPTVARNPFQGEEWKKSPNKTRMRAKMLGWKEDSDFWFDRSGTFKGITTVDGYVKPVVDGNRFNYGEWPELNDMFEVIVEEIEF